MKRGGISWKEPFLFFAECHCGNETPRFKGHKNQTLYHIVFVSGLLAPPSRLFYNADWHSAISAFPGFFTVSQLIWINQCEKCWGRRAVPSNFASPKRRKLFSSMPWILRLLSLSWPAIGSCSVDMGSVMQGRPCNHTTGPKNSVHHAFALGSRFHGGGIG